MKAYGWGLSVSFLDKNNKWTVWLPPGSFFASNYDHDSHGNVPNFFRTRRLAQKYAKENKGKRSKYKIDRYVIEWSKVSN
jgi:hypothetical protein